MSISVARKNPYSWGLAFLLAFGLSWLLYRFVSTDQGALNDAPPPRPPIVSRAEWDARPLNFEAPEEYGAFDSQFNKAGVLVYPNDLQAALNTIVVHHSAFPYAGPLEIQNLHMDKRGFADVAYHYLIDKEGRIYEGRALHIRGAHVQDFNTGSVGIVLLGNFNDEHPSETQLNHLQQLVDYLRYAYGIRYLAGHRDYPAQSPDGTECPGDNLYPHLPEMADSLGMKFGIEGYVAPSWVQ